MRECLEEAGVVVRADRLALVHTMPARHLRQRRSGGLPRSRLPLLVGLRATPHPADGELTEVGFRGLEQLGDLDADHVQHIALALAEDDPATFPRRPVKADLS